MNECQNGSCKGEIILAKNAGFCFGVRRATDAIEKCLAENDADKNGGGNAKIFTLGQIIHNESYTATLAKRGVMAISADEIRRVAGDATPECPVIVFVRAHGMTAQTEELLELLSKENEYFSFVDCTCPFVKHIHDIARNNSAPDKLFILFGQADHPECVGIMSRFNGEKYVFGSYNEFAEAARNGVIVNLHKKTPIITAQTTFYLSEWKKCQENIEKLYTKPVFFDTICNVTESRQREAESIAKRASHMIVVGGRHSSNTTKLYNICKEHCKDTRLAENASQLVFPLSEYKIHDIVGIVAGASTPDNIIKEVYKAMDTEKKISQNEAAAENAESFEQMLETSIKTLNTGDTVVGTVTLVTAGEIQLDLGAYKVTGRIEAEQITDDPSVKLTEMFHIGDEVEGFVIRVSDIEGFATLSKKRVDSDKNWYKIVEACQSGELLRGTVTEVVRGGVVLNVNSNRVFVPASHSGVPKEGDLNTLAGQEVDVKIIEIKEKKAIGSIRIARSELRKAKEEACLADIEIGKKYTGIVKNITQFGVYVDIGGADGMIRISDLSWKRINSPTDVMNIGDVVTVFVKSYNEETKRINLGYRTDETNPWNIFVSTYNVGDVVSVKIVSTKPFGAFAEIIDGVDGLIHISNIANKRIAHPNEVLNVGDVVDVKIIKIDTEKQKVNLSITDVEKDNVEQAAAETVAAAEVGEPEEALVYSTDDEHKDVE